MSECLPRLQANRRTCLRLDICRAHRRHSDAATARSMEHSQTAALRVIPVRRLLRSLPGEGQYPGDSDSSAEQNCREWRRAIRRTAGHENSGVGDVGRGKFIHGTRVGQNCTDAFHEQWVHSPFAGDDECMDGDARYYPPYLPNRIPAVVERGENAGASGVSEATPCLAGHVSARDGVCCKGCGSPCATVPVGSPAAREADYRGDPARIYSAGPIHQRRDSHAANQPAA